MGLINSLRENQKNSLLIDIAKKEEVSLDFLKSKILSGEIVIPLNKIHKIPNPCAIGKNLSVKINANIGTSTDEKDLKDELKKLEIAIKYGSDTVMDLSIGGDLKKILKTILDKSSIPVGTVPIYEATVTAQNKKRNFLKLEPQEILDTIYNQAKMGVDFFTIHSGITLKNLALMKKNKRILNIVSRGGAILASWMKYNKKENPMFEYFDQILDIAREYDVTLSLGDGMRPGTIWDATDKVQIEELLTLGKLAKKAHDFGVQVIIEGPGHVPLNQIKKNIDLEKKFCRGAPFYVLGPLVTDIASGYDHISASIGAALAASYGADFLCYVTPSEHLRHPSIEDVKEGVIASKIAAHAADLAKGIKSAWARDKQMSQARRKRDWKKQISLSLDPEKAKRYRKTSMPRLSDVCTMCGKYCSIKLMDQCLG